METARARILVVDDESSLSRVLRISFVALGFEVAEASTGEQALALLGGEHYDAVLLDIDMPGMDSIEACRRIQHLQGRPAVIMHTARESEQDKARALEAGADEYVIKPVPLRDLVTRVRTALRNRDLHTQS